MSHALSFIIIYLTNLISVANRYGHVPVQANLKDDFKVNDEAIGKIMAIFYIPFVVTAIVYGYLGDRHNRKVILVITTILQSLGVLGCGYSTTTFQFYASKIIIGITQSACITLAPTVISDIYSGASRTKMLGMFATSVAIGSGAGMMGMGGIAKVYGRQIAFSVFSAFTCAFGILYFLVVPDFERGGKETKSTPVIEVDLAEKQPLKTDEPDNNSVATDIVALAKNKTYMLAISAFAATSAVSETTVVWYQELLRRLFVLESRDGTHEIRSCKQDFFKQEHIELYCGSKLKMENMNYSSTFNLTTDNSDIYSNINCSKCDSKKISDYFGILLLTCGLIGTMSGMFLVQLLVRKSSNAGPTVAVGGAIVTGTFMSILVAFAQEIPTNLIWISTAITLIFATSSFGIIQDVIARVVVPERRGLAISLQNFVGRAIGSSFPPILAGAMSDYYLKIAMDASETVKDEDIDAFYQVERFKSLQSAFYVLPAYAFVSAFIWFLCSRKFKNDELKEDR